MLNSIRLIWVKKMSKRITLHSLSLPIVSLLLFSCLFVDVTMLLRNKTYLYIGQCVRSYHFSLIMSCENNPDMQELVKNSKTVVATVG